MTAPAPTTGPTPNNMPKAGPAAGAPGAGDESTTPPDDGGSGDEGGEGEPEPTFEELLAERDKWKTQAKKNEARAKSNADKAKQFDTVAQSEWKKAWEREQAVKNATKTPEQIKAESDAEAERRVQEAENARIEAEANLLRWKLADGKVPAWAMPLVTATEEAEINEQVEGLKKDLAEYAAALLPSNDPRRPAPNPLAGRTTQVGSGPREQFAQAFGQLLNG